MLDWRHQINYIYYMYNLKKVMKYSSLVITFPGKDVCMIPVTLASAYWTTVYTQIYLQLKDCKTWSVVYATSTISVVRILWTLSSELSLRYSGIISPTVNLVITVLQCVFVSFSIIYVSWHAPISGKDLCMREQVRAFAIILRERFHQELSK